MRATLCGARRNRGAKTRVFVFAFWSVRARPSAGIGVVEVQKTRGVFCVFVGARATLCGDRGRGAKTGGFFAFLTFPDEPSAGIGRVEALSLWRCVEALSLWRRAILLLAKWSLKVVSWFARLLSQSRRRGFDPPPGPQQLRLENF